MNSTQVNGGTDIRAMVGQYAAQLQQKPDPDDILSGLWLDLSAGIPEPQPILKQGDANICTKGNFSCIVGPAKSRKTYLISAMVGAFLCDDDFIGLAGVEDAGTVLYIDTEQSLPHVQRVIRRIHRIAGFDPGTNHERLRVLCLRELEPKKRIEAVKQAMERINPLLCVIDGVGDLMDDTNSNTEAVSIATLLLQLTTRYDCHITTAIHTNPNSDKARGHIGSEIIRKAETVISVKKDGDTSRVTAAYCRDLEFQEFAFIIGMDGLPELTEIPVTTPKTEDAAELFNEILPLPTSMTYKDLVEKIMDSRGVSKRTATRRISDAVKNEIISTDDSGYYRMKHKTVKDDETLPF